MSRIVCLIRILRKILKHLVKIMNDLTNLTAAVADLNTKVDAMNAKPAPAVPPDIQPAIDDLTNQVAAIAAKIPA